MGLDFQKFMYWGLLGLAATQGERHIATAHLGKFG